MSSVHGFHSFQNIQNGKKVGSTVYAIPEFLAGSFAVHSWGAFAVGDYLRSGDHLRSCTQQTAIGSSKKAHRIVEGQQILHFVTD